MAATPESPTPDPVELARSMQQSAQDIWLAGMGAFTQAQQQGGGVFDALVRAGQAAQQQAQVAAQAQFAQASAAAPAVQQSAAAAWDRLETLFEQRTARALEQMGMPAAAEVAALQQRVAALEARLAALEARMPPPAQPR